MARLTKRGIEAARYTLAGNRRCMLWDDEPRGLGLRIFPSGRKSWVLSYRIHNRKRLMTLGDLDVLTLDQARSRAKAELAKLENEAADPLTEKRKRVIEAKTGTVAAMVSAYIDQAKAKTAGEMRRQAKKDIEPTFGTRHWRDVRRSEVRAWHAGIRAPYSANRALALLRSAYYWRLSQEDDAPAHRGARRTTHDLSNPCAGIDPNREQPRQVRLERDELPKLEASINAEADPYVKASFRFLLAVGCRRGEALTLKWSDVVDGQATFRETKNDQARSVPLSKYASGVLKSLPRIDGNPFVFVGRTRGSHLSNVSKAWRRIRKRAGVEHVTIHDLRRTFGSWLGDQGFSSKQIGAVLGHKSDITSRVYMSLGDDTKHAAVHAMDKLITQSRKPSRSKRSAKVIPFPKRAAR
jgi:integrase